jgi:uncharacterized RDD family membrane protein YckC
MSMDAPYDPNPPAYTPPPVTGPMPMGPAPTDPSASAYALAYAPAADTFAPPSYTPPSYSPPAPAWTPPPAVYVAPQPVKVERLADELIIPAGYELASARRRVASFFLGLVLLVITLGIGYAIWGVIAWRKGRTPTQQILRLRTERMGDRGPAGWGRMALREVLGRFAELLVPPVVAIISLVMMLTRADRRTIHDLIAGTAVVHALRQLPAPVQPAVVDTEVAEVADVPDNPVAETPVAESPPATAGQPDETPTDASTDLPA